MIHEIILTTRRPDGSIHLAPMGLREQDDLVVIAPFRPSTSLDNLEREGVAVANHIDDVRIFAGCLTGRRDWPLCPAEGGNGQRLQAALAHSELEVVRVEQDELRPRLFCRVLHRTIHAPFRGFNRAQAAVIEAAILVSRLRLLPPEQVESELLYLRNAVEKTAGPHERTAWEWLVEAVIAHRAAVRVEAEV